MNEYSNFYIVALAAMKAINIIMLWAIGVTWITLLFYIRYG